MATSSGLPSSWGRRGLASTWTTCWAKRDIVQEMVDKGVIELTTNLEFDRFVETLQTAGVEATAASKGTLGRGGLPGQVRRDHGAAQPGPGVRIRDPGRRIVADWHAALSAMGEKPNSLDAANAVLPGRINTSTSSTRLRRCGVARFVEMVQSGTGAEDPAWKEQTLGFLELATAGRYPVVDGAVQAVEFTAIYPAGNRQGLGQLQRSQDPRVRRGRRLAPGAPEHGKGIMGMVDYSPLTRAMASSPCSATSMPAASPITRCTTPACVPSSMPPTTCPRTGARSRGVRNPDKNYQNLWVGSRGPASHGCTRLPSGHMSELRDALPSTSEDMEGTPNFRNKNQCYDVFDIDGDGIEEVMGVQYYLAYWGKKHLPVAAYAPNNRRTSTPGCTVTISPWARWAKPPSRRCPCAASRGSRKR